MLFSLFLLSVWSFLLFFFCFYLTFFFMCEQSNFCKDIPEYNNKKTHKTFKVQLQLDSELLHWPYRLRVILQRPTFSSRYQWIKWAKWYTDRTLNCEQMWPMHNQIAYFSGLAQNSCHTLIEDVHSIEMHNIWMA